MSWLKNVLGIGRKAEHAPAPIEGPLGLAPQRAIDFDAAMRILLAGDSQVRLPDSQPIWAEGVIDLGEQHWLSRYYLDEDDFWLQVQTSGHRDGQVSTIILFNYLDCVSISSEQGLALLAGKESKVGLPTYVLNGLTYEREWGVGDGQTELVSFIEHVRNPESRYTVSHHAMLYSRETGLSERREFLLFAVEENESGEISFSTSLGVSLSSIDLKVI